MAISNIRQFGLLLWKNWLLQKRQILLTILQVLLPPLFAVVLYGIRAITDSNFIINSTIWDSFPANNSLPQNLLLPPRIPPPLRYWEIAYAPNVTAIQRIIDNATFMLDRDTVTNAFRNGVKVGRGFRTESELLQFFNDQSQSSTTLGGIIFDENSLINSGDALINNSTVTYKIRLRAEGYNKSYVPEYGESNAWQTNYNYALQLRPGPQGNMYGGFTPGYYYEGFLALQRAVDLSIMNELSGGLSSALADDIELQLKSSPYPPYLDDVFLFILTVQFPFIIMLSFIVIAPTICKDVVLEKEKKLKETMKLMGMKAWLHWLSWFFKYAVFMIISVGIMTIFFHLPYGDSAILNYTDPSITFIFLLLYSLSLITFCFAISAFCSKASAGAAAGGILYLVTYVPFFFIGSIDRYPTLSRGTKAGCSIISNLAMGFGCWILASFESIGAGVQWSTINQTVTVDDNFTMLDIYLFLILDIIIYSLITWYFDALLPGDFGTPLPFYFPFMKSYWCGYCGNTVDVDPSDATDSVDYGDKKEFFEDPSPNDQVGIKIRNLTKKFSKIQRPAVNKLSVDMYEGRITALLGHNGAGKTTTMFMLTGFLPPTSGTAYINGYDLTKDLTRIRQNLGLCPQHDVLFDTLTVEEHLTFYAKLKGCPSSQVSDEVDHMIEVLHLEDKRKVQSKKLSGGMKRKLSVGIALIAGSKFVILDEPTSGMDPEARRQTWDILQSQRAGRTMILSTHFMDEADLLGDRIAIMADGQLQCYGSSLFLKGKYGIGYHLTIVKNSSCNVNRVVQRIKGHVNEAQLESNVGAELSFILPREKSADFERLFNDLEQNRNELGIDSFGASVTTLEEVFLKVGEMCDSGLQSNLQNKTSNDEGESVSVAYVNGASPPETVSSKSLDVSVTYENGISLPSKKSLNSASSGSDSSYSDELFGVGFSRVNGFRRFIQQFYALMIKRILHSARNWIVTIVQIVLPIIFTIIGCIIEKVIVGPSDYPPLPLNLSYFTDPIISSSAGYNLTQEAAVLSDIYLTVAKPWGKINEIPQDTTMDDYLIGIADNLDSYNRYYIVSDTVESMAYVNTAGSPTTVLTGFFNNIALHAIAISLSLADNAILQFVGNRTGSIGIGSRIETINHPLPRSLDQQTTDAIDTAYIIGFTFSYLVSFGMAFLVSTFVVFLVSERATKAKQSQFIAGVGAINYWLSTFLWDAVCFLIPSALIIVVVVAFQTTGYSEAEIAGYFFLDLVLYGWSVIPFAYLLSFLFNVSSSAYTWVLIINLFTGTVAQLTVFILKLPGLGTYSVGEGLEWVFYALLPNFCFNKALQDVFSNYQYGQSCAQIDKASNRTVFCQLIKDFNSTNPCCANACGDQCALVNDNYLSWAAPGIGRSLMFMLIQGANFLIILFCLESSTVQRVLQKSTARESNIPLMVSADAGGDIYEVVEMSGIGLPSQVIEDDDVRAERERVNQVSSNSNKDKVILRELTKFYNGTFLAVDRLSVSIPDGECFGLLGVNGAGKTTTFKMLTGDETASAGEAILDGISVQQDVQSARERAGYCPQFDALIDQMTVTETLWMYARLRGVVEEDIENLVEKMIEQLTLTKHAKKQAKNLSGGNRRKLSTGVALIGNPSIVFLDEPTTGMDPVARRLLWNTLAAIRDSGRTLILTSHSMEECEALCTRIAIMVNGRFQCIGSTQRLKAKFGDGYSLIIKIRQASGKQEVETVEGPAKEHRTSVMRSMSSRIRTNSVASSEYSEVTWHYQMEVKTKRVMEFVKSRFPGSQLKDQHDGLLHYRILPDEETNFGANADNRRDQNQQQVSWAYVFGEIERAKDDLDIEDYSVSQTTLEQVFISFARMQRPPQEVERTTCCGWNCTCYSCCHKKSE